METREERESEKEATKSFMTWFFISPKSFNNLSEGKLALFSWATDAKSIVRQLFIVSVFV